MFRVPTLSLGPPLLRDNSLNSDKDIINHQPSSRVVHGFFPSRTPLANFNPTSLQSLALYSILQPPEPAHVPPVVFLPPGTRLWLLDSVQLSCLPALTDSQTRHPTTKNATSREFMVTVSFLRAAPEHLQHFRHLGRPAVLLSHLPTIFCNLLPTSVSPPGTSPVLHKAQSASWQVQQSPGHFTPYIWIIFTFK